MTEKTISKMRSCCPAPDAVNSYPDLLKFRTKYKDTIFVSIDIEMIDHRAHLTQKEKLSEMGLAVYDPRAAPSTNSEASHIQAITVHHSIVKEWAWVTDKTCPNRNKFWHRGIHKASPYTATFCYTKIKQGPEILAELIEYLESLKNQSLTAQEIATNHKRQVVLLSWDATAEAKLFADYGYWCWDHDIEHWDLQLWLPVLIRFGSKDKTGAERFYSTTGVLGSEDCSVTLHNASNDAWAQVATLARFLCMSEESFRGWLSGMEELKPLNMHWVDGQISRYNAALEKQYVKGSRRNDTTFSGVSMTIRPAPNNHHHDHTNTLPSVDDKQSFPDLPSSLHKNNETATKPAWEAKTSTQQVYKQKDGRAPLSNHQSNGSQGNTTQEAESAPWSQSHRPGPSSSGQSGNTSATPSPTLSASTPASTPPTSVATSRSPTPTSRTPSPLTPGVNNPAALGLGGSTVGGSSHISRNGPRASSSRPTAPSITWASVASGAGAGQGSYLTGAQRQGGTRQQSGTTNQNARGGQNWKSKVKCGARVVGETIRGAAAGEAS